MCIRDRPYIVVNGTYHSEFERDAGFADDKIHCVYAGTFDPTKGGADAAAAAEFLQMCIRDRESTYSLRQHISSQMRTQFLMCAVPCLLYTSRCV